MDDHESTRVEEVFLEGVGGCVDAYSIVAFIIVLQFEREFHNYNYVKGFQEKTIAVNFK